MPSGTALKCTSDIKQDLHTLCGAQPAVPRNQSFVGGSELYGMLRDLYANSMKGGATVNDADKAEIDRYNQLIDENIVKKQIYKKKLQQDPTETSYINMIRNYDNMNGQYGQKQKDILNKYGGAAISYLSRQFDSFPEDSAQIYPNDYADMINNYTDDEISARYVAVKMNHMNKHDSSSQKMRDIKTGGGWGLFVSANVENHHETEDISSKFSQTQIEMSTFSGDFVRPWMNEMLFALDGVSVNNLPVGYYSNGQKINKLQGTMALIPVQYIVAKDIKITISGRDTKQHSMVDTIKADTAVGWGPFSVHASVNQTTKNHDN